MLTKINQKQLKPYHGIGDFALVILAMVFAAAPIQRKWGMYGLAITELIILLLAVVPAVILKTNLKEIFPVKKPQFRQVLGVLIIWMGSYFAVLLITLLISYFFPEGFKDVNGGIQNMITSVPFGTAFIITALMPAICEEALHRGFILSSLASIKSKWIIILSMGVIFGVFHLNLYRFLPTAVLGMALTYIMIETRNMVLPAFFHFINNALSTFASFTTKSQGALTTNSGMVLTAISSYLIIGAVIPFLLVLGSRLIHERESDSADIAIKKRRKNKIIITTVFCSAFMILSGTVIMILNINKAPVFQTSVSMDVNRNSDNLHIPMKIDKSGEYILDLDVKSAKGLVGIDITDESGKEVFQMSCGEATSTGPIKLGKNTYTINVNFLMDMNEIEEYFTKRGLDYDADLKEKLNLNEDSDEFSNFRMNIVIK